MPGIPVDELFSDFFLPIGRDAAGVAEVQVRLQKALAETGREAGDDRYVDAALRHSRVALERAGKSLSVGEDIDHVRRATDQTALACGAG